jgi:hypothetical protein
MGLNSQMLLRPYRLYDVVVTDSLVYFFLVCDTYTGYV